MSITSKHKRDARRKQASKTAARGTPAPMQEHAHLLDAQGRAWGGAGRRGADWVMVLDGKPVADTDSAGMVLAMLRHVAALREASGESVRLQYTRTLGDAAAAEAEAQGKTLDEFLAMLEAERAERAGEKGQAEPVQRH